MALRQAARRLFRSPGFATLAIGMLVGGVGINTAMLAVMDALFFRAPFHVADPSAVVRVEFTVLDQGEPEPADRTHYPNVVDLEASGTFDAIAAYRATPVSVGRGADANVAHAMVVSHRFFDLLRPVPHLGQLSLGNASDEGGDRVVISFTFWQRRFAANPQVVGAAVALDGRDYVVAGVAPAGFQALSARPIDVWLPLAHASVNRMAPARWREERGRAWLSVVARLRADVTVATAEERAGALLANRGIALGDEERATHVNTTSVVPGRDGSRTFEGRVAMWLAGVSALVLLMACANVANLVGARMFAHRRDGFIRRTLGASTGHLVRQWLLETALILIPGIAGALVLSFVLRNAVAAYLSTELPLSRDAWDPRTLGLTVASAMAAFLCISAVSLWQLRTTVVDNGLLSRASAAGSARRTRRALLAAQACLCLVLLFIAGLFAMSLRRVEALDLGVDVDRTIQVTLAASRLSGDYRDVFERARATLAADGEVEQVAFAEASPFMSGSGIGPWTSERSWSDLWADREVAYRSVVGGGFFSAVGAKSVRGRDFTEADGPAGPPVAIINAPLAAYLWPGGEALGQCMWLDRDGRACVRVVGVLGGVWKMSALRRDRMAVYLPLAQVPEASPGVLFVRPRGDPSALIPQVRTVVQTLRADLPAASIVLMRDVVAPEFRPWRLGSRVFTGFALLALLIASIGLYGVVAFATTLRTREIGVRLAIGARPTHIVRTVVAEGVGAVTTGLIAGAGLIAIASRSLGGVLFETSPGDPVVVLQTALVLIVVSVLALMVPAARALRTNPADVLRSD